MSPEAKRPAPEYGDSMAIRPKYPRIYPIIGIGVFARNRVRGVVQSTHSAVGQFRLHLHARTVNLSQAAVPRQRQV